MSVGIVCPEHQRRRNTTPQQADCSSLVRTARPVPKTCAIGEDTHHDFGRAAYPRRDRSDFAADQIEGVVPASVVAVRSR